MLSIQDQLYRKSVKEMGLFLERIRQKRREKVNDLVRSMESCVIDVENEEQKDIKEGFTTRTDVEPSVDTENKEIIKEMWSSVFGNVTVMGRSIIPDYPVPLNIGAIKKLRKEEESIVRYCFNQKQPEVSKSTRDDYDMEERSYEGIQLAHYCRNNLLPALKQCEGSKSTTGNDRVKERSSCVKRQIALDHRKKRLREQRQLETSKSSRRDSLEERRSHTRIPISHNGRDNHWLARKQSDEESRSSRDYDRVEEMSHTRRPISDYGKENHWLARKQSDEESRSSRDYDRVEERIRAKRRISRNRRNNRLQTRVQHEESRSSQDDDCVII